MKAAVVVFLGTNCEVETKRALEHCGYECDYVHSDLKSLLDYDCVFLCGGFSYGDYIRAGRLAKFTPVAEALNSYVEKQRGVLAGICNGFQILCETKLLPGALLENENSKFICKNVFLELDLNGKKETITLPVAHKEGRYFCDATLRDMIFLKYLENINGSSDNVAGLYDKNRRIMGLMPHPERAIFAKNFGFDGKKIFDFIRDEVARG